MPSERAEELRRDYLADTCSALKRYVEGGHSLRINSTGNCGTGLAVTFMLHDGETFHSTLREITDQRVAEWSRLAG